MSDHPQTPHLRGFTVSNTIQWARNTYGDPVLQRAIERLEDEDRRLFQRSIMSMSWYPIEAWDRFLAALYEEIRAVSGEDDETLDRRNVREGGGAVMRTIYRFFFAFMEPVSTLSRLNTTFPRVYSHGRSEHVENRLGLNINRCTVPKEMRGNITRVMRHGLVYILEMVGAKEVVVEVSRDEVNPLNPHEWIVETTTRYHL